MNPRRRMTSVGVFGLVLLSSLHAPMAAPKARAWTPQQVRALVLRVETKMLDLENEQLKASLRGLGTCRSFAIGPAVKKSVALPQIEALVTGRAVSCYVASYLGCSSGEWIARSRQVVTIRRPFKRSKVTIIEQTQDRIVADVTEIPADDFYTGGDAKVWLEKWDSTRPYTEAEIAATTAKSRYTITRGNDGRWRIADREPSFDWVCDDSPVRAPVDKSVPAPSR